MDALQIPKEDQLPVGPLFNDPTLVETMAAASVPEIAPRGRKKAGVADEASKMRHEATALDLLRLPNPLSPLYPKESEEKRLLDAMLPAAPR